MASYSVIVVRFRCGYGACASIVIAMPSEVRRGGVAHIVENMGYDEDLFDLGHSVLRRID
jgi:hypothetical protein